jgi:trehalose 6-phosphate synthase
MGGGLLARLVIVSNRVALPRDRELKAGGLAVALMEALEAEGGLWFGWSGAVVETADAPPKIARADSIDFATVDLSTSEHETFYAGFSNATLWPLFHYRLGLIDFRRSQLRGYVAVNERFARALRPLLRPDDVIWVHDYHFMAMAEELRRLGVANPIGFFLHIPFPAPEVLAALPGHERLIQALLAYDLLGFQTKSDRRAFENCVLEATGGRVLGDGRVTDGRCAAATGVFPVGIDVDEFTAMAEKAAGGRETHRLIESLAGRRLVIGVDRLDYSKGLPKRFDAFHELLSGWPEHNRRVTLLQIAPISRGEVAQYRSLRRELDSLAGRINSKFAEFDWAPIRYLNRPFPRRSLAGFYRAARVGLVTPLRDGMNLVAKEYVAAQDRADPGVLVLSRFAGAAHELTAALLVNPFDTEGVAEAIHRGLTMPVEERRERWSAMMSVMRRTTQRDWSNRFVESLVAAHARDAAPRPAAATAE